MKRKPKRRRRAAPVKRAAPVEDRRAEAVTVAWMLTLIATLGAEIIGAIIRAVVITAGSDPGASLAASGLLLFIAAVTGLVCLLLTPLVYRFRHVPPPTPITIIAVTASVLPLLVGMMLAVR